MPFPTNQLPIIPAAVWQKEAERHFREAIQFTGDARKRRDRGEPHPVEDFLFEYYPYPISLIEQWHPGLGFALEVLDPETMPPHLCGKRYKIEAGRCFLAAEQINEKLRARLGWIKNLLEATQAHVPNFGCHGLHEWAMVYRAENVRHSSLAPLRLSQAEVDSVVESRPISCTHHDAFRFFATQARPLNRLQPTIETREQNEQPGCVHANMDLYKWAAKSMPWIGSALLLEAFRLANELRDLDMRASPYDLSAWGLDPIRIETPAGRKEYETEQRRLAALAMTLRRRLIDKLNEIALS